jgi:hypothetical protein
VRLTAFQRLIIARLQMASHARGHGHGHAKHHLSSAANGNHHDMMGWCDGITNLNEGDAATDLVAQVMHAIAMAMAVILLCFGMPKPTTLLIW